MTAADRGSKYHKKSSGYIPGPLIPLHVAQRPLVASQSRNVVGLLVLGPVILQGKELLEGLAKQEGVAGDFPPDRGGRCYALIVAGPNFYCRVELHDAVKAFPLLPCITSRKRRASAADFADEKEIAGQ